MKKLTIIASALALMALPAMAGEYHFEDTLICQQCHVMHGSLSHTYGDATPPPVTSWPLTEYLLQGPVNDMCLSCHNNQVFAPDVIGNNTGSSPAPRSAGSLNTIVGIVDGYDTWMGHTLGSTDQAPGDTGSFLPDATAGLTCVNCHHQHGYAGFNTEDVFGNSLSDNYRNLAAKNVGGQNYSISYAITTNDLTRDVFEAGPMDYSTDGNQLNEPVTTDSGYGTWCQSCHVNFHGDVGDPNSIGGSGAPPEMFVRHPNATVNIGDLGGGHSSIGVWRSKLYRVRVMTTAGDWGTQGTAWTAAPANDLTPTCLSCHKAHGTQNAFGLIYAAGAAPLQEDGDGTAVRDLCKQCHVQGG